MVNLFSPESILLVRLQYSLPLALYLLLPQ
jgi:hypothetical protein